MTANAHDLADVHSTALEERLAQLRRQYLGLSAGNRTLTSPDDEQQLLTEICRALVDIGGYRLAWLGLSGTRGDAVAGPIASAARPPRAVDPPHLGWAQALDGHTPAIRAMRERAPQIVHEIEDERWSASWRTQARDAGYAAVLAMPLLADEHCLGVLEIYTDRSYGFEIAELVLLHALAADLAFGLAALRTRHECQRQRADIARLTRVLKMQTAINSAILRIRDRSLLLQEACRIAVDVGGYSSAVVWAVEPGARYARPGFRAGKRMPAVAPDPLPIGVGWERDTSLTGRAMRTGEVTVCRDLTGNEPPVVGRQLLYAEGVRSVVALPFMVDGIPVGALTLTSADPTLVHEDELSLLFEMSASLSFAVCSQQHADAAEYLAHYDPLTGLAKRPLFCRRVDRMLHARFSPEETPTVAVLDIDHLNKFNDSFGRPFGDLLLQQVAQRLRHYAGSDERVGDLGGGTFALVEPTSGMVGQDVATVLESTIFKECFVINGRSVRVACRSGVAHHRTDGDDGSALVQHAEAALKHAKETGRKNEHYKPEMHNEMAERLTLEHRLRGAVDAYEFELYYQPQINIATGRIQSLEALLRWNDPEHGLVLPAGFLPVLESSGMIIPVGQWVVQRALQDCDRWRALGLRPVRVAVNVSAVQFRGRVFVDFILGLLKDWPHDPLGFGIDLEITETALLQDIDGASRQLRELRAAGIRVALDDFGTGYSSLGLLSRLPVDQLKIDRSFVKGLLDDHTSMTLTRTIIGLASAFGLQTVAEGVETADQLKLLRLLNCDLAQGYLHCPPVPAKEIDRLLTDDP
jgi:diguanylate cyclase (GGDEF)-like protein